MESNEKKKFVYDIRNTVAVKRNMFFASIVQSNHGEYDREFWKQC